MQEPSVSHKSKGPVDHGQQPLPSTPPTASGRCQRMLLLCFPGLWWFPESQGLTVFLAQDHLFVTLTGWARV